MDQYSSVMGRQGCALLIDCRYLTSEIKTISPEIRVMICDTRAKRELTGSEYSSRRAQCEEGVRVLRKYDPQIQSLRDVSRELLQKYENILDPVVYKRCHFVIEENLRVQKISCALEQGDRKMIGQVTEESFLGTKDLYQIVTEEMAAMYTSIMNAPGTFGARAAGAGFGGCLVSFVDNNLTEVFSEHVFESYLNATGIEPEIFTVSAANGSGIADISNGN
jgi:galactokinase